MAYEIKWTPLARDNYHQVVSYLYDEWGPSQAEIFTDELQSRLSNLEHLPSIGKQHPAIPSVRQLVLGKHQSLFYTVIEKMVIVLNIVDNRTMK